LEISFMNIILSPGILVKKRNTMTKD